MLETDGERLLSSADTAVVVRGGWQDDKEGYTVTQQVQNKRHKRGKHTTKRGKRDTSVHTYLQIKVDEVYFSTI